MKCNLPPTLASPQIKQDAGRTQRCRWLAARGALPSQQDVSLCVAAEVRAFPDRFLAGLLYRRPSRITAQRLALKG